MEITEPVILRIQQGRKTVQLEITSRAEARDLIAVIARRMPDLPDDGEGLIAPVELLDLPDAAEEEHTAEATPAATPGPAAVPAADGESPARNAGCPECHVSGGRHLGNCKTGTKLAHLGKQVARLSKPPCGARPYPAGSEGDDGTACTLPAGHAGPHDDGTVPGYELGDAVRTRFRREAAPPAPRPLAGVRALRPDSEVTIIGSVADSSTFNCCQTPMPWPAKGMDVQCPECSSVWEREPVDIGAGARLKILVIDGRAVPREHGAAS